MQRHESELAVTRILANVEHGLPVEDDVRFELKREWPECDLRTARRIAAHANAARGEDILWIIGADEMQAVVLGAPGLDIARWYDQVRSHFESHWSPSLRTQLIPWRDVTVSALVFETEGAPFLVRSGDHLEVPWRSGTRTRSAKRHELLQLLQPASRLPHVEIRSGRVGQSRSASKIAPWSFRLAFTVYITPLDERAIVLPFHRMKGAILNRHGGSQVELRDFRADANRLVSPYATKDIPIDSPFLRITEDELIASGPCRLRILSFGRVRDFDIHDLGDYCEVALSLRPAGDTPGNITLRPRFVRTSVEDEEDAAWLYVPDDVLNRASS